MHKVCLRQHPSLTQLGVMQTQHQALISMAYASPAAQHIVGQYYQFLRMGHAGYLRVLHGCATVAAHLADGIAATGAFTILSVCAPLLGRQKSSSASPNIT